MSIVDVRSIGAKHVVEGIQFGVASDPSVAPLLYGQVARALDEIRADSVDCLNDIDRQVLVHWLNIFLLPRHHGTDHLIHHRFKFLPRFLQALTRCFVFIRLFLIRQSFRCSGLGLLGAVRFFNGLPFRQSFRLRLVDRVFCHHSIKLGLVVESVGDNVSLVVDRRVRGRIYVRLVCLLNVRVGENARVGCREPRLGKVLNDVHECWIIEYRAVELIVRPRRAAIHTRIKVLRWKSRNLWWFGS